MNNNKLDTNSLKPEIKNEKSELLLYENGYIIIAKDDLPIENFKEFKNISVWPAKKDNQEWKLVDLDFEKDIIFLFYKLLVELLIDKSLLECLNELSRKFRKFRMNEDYLKFRGDFSEALYILKNRKARKLIDCETADINDCGEIIEIKSFTEGKMEVVISLKQLLEKTRKIAIPLNNSTDGMSIVEVSKRISDKHFAEYLYEKYNNSEYEMIKYDTNVNFIDFTKKIDLKQHHLPKEVVRASFTIRIM